MQGTVSRGAVQTRDLWTDQKTVVYPAQEEGRGQREDAPGREHPTRGNWNNRWNRWQTPLASQGRAGGENGPRTEGAQLQTPGKRTGAERHVGGPADAVAAGS